MKKIAISIGDINGIGPQIALISHDIIKKICSPVYCVHEEILKQACEILKIPMPKDVVFAEPDTRPVLIHPGCMEEKSGAYSYESFKMACDLADKKVVHGVCTLPINKGAWQLACVNAISHTDYLRQRYNKQAIMMLGCEKMFVALFTEHLALKEVSQKIQKTALVDFMINFACCSKAKKALVLGLNPHCGDNGAMGDEEKIIQIAIAQANKTLKKNIFDGPVAADTAFSPENRRKYLFFIGMYHDVALAPLKALYFYESINVTLNIPILRTSVDHGTAYDKAYRTNPNTQSYCNAVEKIALS